MHYYRIIPKVTKSVYVVVNLKILVIIEFRTRCKNYVWLVGLADTKEHFTLSCQSWKVKWQEVKEEELE